MEYRKVAIAGFEDVPKNVHTALLDPNDKWNGWACPYFERDEVLKMAGWLSDMFTEDLVYDAGTDTFTVYECGEAIEDACGMDIEGHHVYPLGTGWWTWLIVDDNE